MTTVTFHTQGSRITGFDAAGHSGYAEEGGDIVCAAVSVLVINAVNSLEELANEDISCTADEKTGFIQCTFNKEISAQGTLLMDSLVLGLSHIEKEYGNKFLKLTFEEV